MVVTSTTVSHTVLATFLGVEVGILSQVFSGTELHTGQPADLTGSWVVTTGATGTTGATTATGAITAP